MKILLTLVACIGMCITTQGQPTFQKYYGFGLELGTNIIECDSGFIMLSAYNFTNASDVLISKLDYEGNVIWAKTYGGIASDQAFSIDRTYDGGFIIAGYSNSFGGLSPNEFDYILLFKIDNAGNLLWSWVMDIGGVDVAYSVRETVDNGFVLTGTATIGFANMFVIKTDSVGVIEWAHEYGSSINSFDSGRSIIQLRDGNYAVLSMSNETSALDTTAVVYIINPSGVAIFSHHYRIMNSSVSDDITYAYSLCQDQNGNLLVAGGNGGFFQNLFYAYSPFILKTDSVGNYLGGKNYSLNTGAGQAYSVSENPGGGFILGGTMGNYYPLMIETDANLNTNWCYYYGSFGGAQSFNGGYGFGAIPVSSGGYALVGYRTFTNPGLFATVVKTDEFGLTGCNQSVPSFNGVASNFTYTEVMGSIDTFGTVSQLQVTLMTSNIALSEHIICTSTNLEEVSGFTFSLYPNPVHEKLHLQLHEGIHALVDVEIRDITGRLVMKKSFSSGMFEINISALQCGVYTITLDENRSIIRRFIKQ